MQAKALKKVHWKALWNLHENASTDHTLVIDRHCIIQRGLYRFQTIKVHGQNGRVLFCLYVPRSDQWLDTGYLGGHLVYSHGAGVELTIT